MPALQVQFTIDDRARGDAIASELLRDRLVACVQTLGPITSRYWWDGSVAEAQEWMFVCKTTAEDVAEVVENVRVRHPYDVPEIVACEFATGFEPYLRWIAAETARPHPGGPRAATDRPPGG